MRRNGKTYPQSLDHFRLTSADQAAIAEIASRYGGNPHPWPEAPTAGQWQVTIEADELPIALPPDPLGGTPVYELWSKGGCVRRCDGQTVMIQAPGPEGTSLEPVPCICNAQEQLLCKPITRLNVILREIRFGGTWMLEAHGWNAFQEMPGTVEMIEGLQGRTIVRASLALESRETVVAGKTKKYVVPVIRLADSAEALVAGAASLRVLATADQMRPALGPVTDPEIVDAEIVDVREDAIRDAVDGLAVQLGMGFQVLLDKLIYKATGKTVVGSEDEWQRLELLVNDLVTGRAQITSTGDGRLRLTRTT